jgi:hypothetical protein
MTRRETALFWLVNIDARRQELTAAANAMDDQLHTLARLEDVLQSFLKCTHLEDYRR